MTEVCANGLVCDRLMASLCLCAKVCRMKRFSSSLLLGVRHGQVW